MLKLGKKDTKAVYLVLVEHEMDSLTGNIVSKAIRYITIDTIYKGIQLIWTLINSCFGSGTWISNKLWIRSDKWKNN